VRADRPVDEIRPDWEMKLNAVKAAAARKASRRIVMRQVGDRLIPIGYTSARAPGTADFSMSIPSADASGGSSPRRDRRRGSGRERDLEQVCITICWVLDPGLTSNRLAHVGSGYTTEFDRPRAASTASRGRSEGHQTARFGLCHRRQRR
jgi:hypothetical protein